VTPGAGHLGKSAAEAFFQAPKKLTAEMEKEERRAARVGMLGAGRFIRPSAKPGGIDRRNFAAYSAAGTRRVAPVISPYPV
jgi:hypothetical protein